MKTIEDKSIKLMDLVRAYYNTRDEKLRNELISLYMPYCERMADKYCNHNNREDLLQSAYLKLIEYIDKYNPYVNNHITNYLYTYIEAYIKNLADKEKENVSLSNIDVYSNINYEDKIIDKLYTQYLYNLIIDYVNKNQMYNYIDIFRRLYGLGYKKKSVDQISKEAGYSREYINKCRIKVFYYMYLELIKVEAYLPERKMRYLVDTNNNRVNRILPKSVINDFRSIDFSKMEDLLFYRDCDDINYNHEVVLRMNKK